MGVSHVPHDDDVDEVVSDDAGSRVEDLPETADRVLAVIDQIPPGRVATYGDVGAAAGCGPRQVGQILSRYGSMVGWWRVLRAGGSPPLGKEGIAREHYAAEGTPMRGDRVDLTLARHPLHPPREL